MAEQSTSRRPRVVIVGAGFGGINAAAGLAKLPVDVTVVDRKNHHTFQPLLYQVALAVLSPGDIAQPIRSILRENTNTEVIMDEVTGFDMAERHIMLKSGAVLIYDYLILATGSTHSYFGKDEWAKLAPGLKTIEDATEIRRRVLLAFELAERQKLESGSHPPLNFVIVGGGPTGVELAGSISDIAKLYMTKDFRHIDPGTAQVLILEGSPNILGAYPEDLQKKAVEQLNALGVRVRTGAHVSDIQPGYVMVGDERVESVCTLWAAGVQASPLGKILGVETDRRGSVMVDDHLHPAGHSEIFVLGDLAHFEQDGKQVPGVAQPAMQMGAYAAKRIGLLLEGKGDTQKPFRYFDKGDMATIGRKAAVARIVWPFHAHWSGFMAWLTWLVVHIFFLIGFRNRLSVFRQWAYTYVRFQDGVRLIVGSQELPGWDKLAPSVGPITNGDPQPEPQRADSSTTTVV
ncbi:NAD(P)/FAD-dependent oxidoreductase [Granulicella mallensis]|uniref:NADH:ubiquinone reductase (non-electrogenic) n=1 Tax=Granulicella mallensis (strain ATCC BAA-1857 / DSM 23137 / MP5ACTX8) TaxID=682795 RepID=G8NQ91_GRAMM|nr:NAD(P)/FAD-dependent oxidoreductase [Granulicella mallensis]AEU34947.1 NADH dehydrogenase (ubiquinone) [Granulicella mallensis MP5ACTX8]